MEGSALSERDLVRTRAHSGSAILLLADRFSPSSHQEDLGLQFQVSTPTQTCSQLPQACPVNAPSYCITENKMSWVSRPCRCVTGMAFSETSWSSGLQ